MYTRGRLVTSNPKVATIFLIAAIFGTLAFLFSFLGFFNTQSTTNRVNIYGSISLQEVGGHFLFGYIVALPTRNLRIGILAGLMAIALDTDHIPNAVGFQIQGRASHSISFAILASILTGIIAAQIFRKTPSVNRMTTIQTGLVSSSKNIEQKIVADTSETQGSLMSADKKKIFFQFLIIALAAYMSHIAYDVFVDARAYFPLFAPFSFEDILIPKIYALPIEGLAILFVYLGYMILARRSI